MIHKIVLLASLAMFADAAIAADEGLALTERHLNAGTLSAGEAALQAHLKQRPDDDQARFGLGVVQFLRAVEGVPQALYRHGFLAPVVQMIPESQRGQIPFPINARPERLTYQKAREIAQAFNSRLAIAEATLSQIQSDAVKLPLYVGLIRLDLDGDGKATEGEAFWRLLQRASGEAARKEDDFKHSFIAFDAADACWLRGYCHLLMALTEMSLAYEWRELFELTAHRLFPEIDPPFPFAQEKLEGNEIYWSVGVQADLIAFLHLINFNLSEPKRMSAALKHLESTVELSRRTWDLILKETDDDQEWIPSPNQTGVVPGIKITPEIVAGWQEFLSEADSILKGKKLLPFWRGNGERGINLRKVFVEPKRFDLVLWMQGTGLIPFLEAGELTEGKTWERIISGFEDGLRFVGFALWFN
jgi:hypothetical protein